MSYRDQLKAKIAELEAKIASDSLDKKILEKELQDFMRKDFEEEMREDNNRKLLQG